MARDDENSAISLFSFQDIITSITGIMFLVVLLLLLIAITSRPGAEVRRPDTTEAAELRRELDSLRTELNQLEQNSRHLDAELEHLKKLSAAELARRRSELQSQVAAARSETDLRRAERIRMELTEARQTEEIRQLVRIEAGLHTELQDFQQQNQAARQRLEERRKLVRQRERVMKYTITGHDAKDPLLLELGADGGRVLQVADGGTEDFRTPGNGTNSLERLRQWLQVQNRQQVYFSVVVKPGGFRYAGDVLALLSEAGFERGLEILPSDESTIFEESQP